MLNYSDSIYACVLLLILYSPSLSLLLLDANQTRQYFINPHLYITWCLWTDLDYYFHLKNKLTMELVLSSSSIAAVCSALVISLILLLYYTCKILNWVWFRPRKLEKRLRKEGFNGNSYKLFFGDMKEMGAMIKEAKSKPMNFSNDIVPRVLPIFHKSIKNYGMCISEFIFQRIETCVVF